VQPALMQVAESEKVLQRIVDVPVQPVCHEQPCWLPHEIWSVNVEHPSAAPVHCIPTLS
jgi:hypothetical protein